MAAALLIDTAVIGYETIAAAARSDVAIILFDRYTDTLETLKHKIQATVPNTVQTIGIIQHGNQYISTYKLLETQATPALINAAESDDPTLQSWGELKDFYGWLKARGATTIDLISCALYANSGWVYVLQQLEQQLTLDFRASINNTGNIASGGDWIQESDGVNIQTIYFTEAIEQYTGFLYYSRSSRPYNNIAVVPGTTVNSSPLLGNVVQRNTIRRKSLSTGFVTKGPIIYDSIFGWSRFANGGGGLQTGSGFVAIASSTGAHATLKEDGSIYAWGSADHGGSGAPSGSGFVAVISTDSAFAALKSDGTLVSWGNPSNGGSGAPTGSGFVNIASNEAAFVALRSNGTVAAWGESLFGVSGAPTDSGYVAIASSRITFAALRANGSIRPWGSRTNGGDFAPTGTGFVGISEGYNSYAALTATGSVAAWGRIDFYGPDPPDSGYVAVTATEDAFAALKSDGTIYAWGDSTYGGTGAPTGSGYVAIASSAQAFAALKSDGTIVAWGNAANGGSGAPTNSGYIAITSNYNAFAALKSDGSITAWGNSSLGGTSPAGSGFIAIASNFGAFAALKSDGSITVWGASFYSGPGSTGLPTDAGYRAIYSTDTAFAGLKASIPASAASAMTNGRIGNYVVLSTDPTLTVTLTSRTAVKNNASAVINYIKGMIQRTSTGIFTIPSSSFTAFKDTLVSGANFLTVAKDVKQYFPSMNAFDNAATLEIASLPTDNSVYVCLELPLNVPVTLVENGTPVSNGTLFFDGTTLYRNSTNSPPIITAGSTQTFGTKTINNIAIGSLTGNGGPLPAPPATAPTINPVPQVLSLTSIQYNWTADPSQYQYILTLTDGTTQIIQTISSSTNTYPFTGLTSGRNYTTSIVVTDVYNQPSPVSTFNSVSLGIITIRPNPQVSSNTITCYWTPDPTIIASYTIACEGPGGGTQTVPSTAAGQVTFSGLTNGTLYTPTIFATDSLSTSTPPISFRTVAPCNRSDPPTNVVFTQQPGSVLHVAWSSPTPPVEGPPVLGYVIRDENRTKQLTIGVEDFRREFSIPIPVGIGTRRYAITAVNYAGHSAPVFSTPLTF